MGEAKPRIWGEILKKFGDRKEISDFCVWEERLEVYNRGGHAEIRGV